MGDSQNPAIIPRGGKKFELAFSPGYIPNLA